MTRRISPPPSPVQRGKLIAINLLACAVLGLLLIAVLKF